MSRPICGRPVQTQRLTPTTKSQSKNVNRNIFFKLSYELEQCSKRKGSAFTRNSVKQIKKINFKCQGYIVFNIYF